MTLIKFFYKKDGMWVIAGGSGMPNEGYYFMFELERNEVALCCVSEVHIMYQGGYEGYMQFIRRKGYKIEYIAL
jgi:hypothetical protein